MTFDSGTPIGVELFDLRTGRTAKALLYGAPVKLAFAGHSLCVCTEPAAGPQLRVFNPIVRKGKLSLAYKRLMKLGGNDYLAAVAGGVPVIVGERGKSLTIGRRVIRPRGGFRGIRKVVGARNSVLVVQGDGRFGIAEAPAWRYNALGHIGPNQFCGAGHNSRGFWFARHGLKITLINRSGKMSTLNVPVPVPTNH